MSMSERFGDRIWHTAVTEASKQRCGGGCKGERGKKGAEERRIEGAEGDAERGMKNAEMKIKIQWVGNAGGAEVGGGQKPIRPGYKPGHTD